MARIRIKTKTKCERCGLKYHRVYSCNDKIVCHRCYMKGKIRMPMHHSLEDMENRTRMIQWKNKRHGVLYLPSSLVGMKIKIKFVEDDNKVQVEEEQNE